MVTVYALKGLEKAKKLTKKKGNKKNMKRKLSSKRCRSMSYLKPTFSTLMHRDDGFG